MVKEPGGGEIKKQKSVGSIWISEAGCIWRLGAVTKRTLSATKYTYAHLNLSQRYTWCRPMYHKG